MKQTRSVLAMANCWLLLQSNIQEKEEINALVIMEIKSDRAEESRQRKSVKITWDPLETSQKSKYNSILWIMCNCLSAPVILNPHVPTEIARR